MQASSFGNYIAEQAFKNSFVQQSHSDVKIVSIFFESPPVIERATADGKEETLEVPVICRLDTE